MPTIDSIRIYRIFNTFCVDYVLQNKSLKPTESSNLRFYIAMYLRDLLWSR